MTTGIHTFAGRLASIRPLVWMRAFRADLFDGLDWCRPTHAEFDALDEISHNLETHAEEGTVTFKARYGMMRTVRRARGYVCRVQSGPEFRTLLGRRAYGWCRSAAARDGRARRLETLLSMRQAGQQEGAR